MPQSDRVTELPLQEVERPKCPLCKAGMWLMHIVPEEPGSDRRTFTCPVCEYSESVVSVHKPMPAKCQ